MSARDVALAWARTQLGAPVLMGYRGDLRFDRELRHLVPHELGLLVWDCSGYVGGGIKAAGGPDLRGTHNAQKYHDDMRPLGPGEIVLPGDCVFYGLTGPTDVEHVVFWAGSVDPVGGAPAPLPTWWQGHVLSADGATHAITDLAVAKAKGCIVREHDRVLYRGDCKYVVARRNIFLDRLDGIER